MLRGRIRGPGFAVDREAQPGVQLGRAGGIEKDVVHGPVGRQRNEPAFGQHGDDRDRHAHSREHPSERPGPDKVPASVDENDVTRRVIDQRGGVERQDGDTVLQQPEGGKDLRGGLAGGGHQDEIHMRLQGRYVDLQVSGGSFG